MLTRALNIRLPKMTLPCNPCPTLFNIANCRNNLPVAYFRLGCQLVTSNEVETTRISLVRTLITHIREC